MSKKTGQGDDRKVTKNLCQRGNCNVENVDKDHKSSFTLCMYAVVCSIHTLSYSGLGLHTYIHWSE